MTSAMTITTFDAKVSDFLAQRRIAVAGVSRDNSHHPASNLIYRRLKSTGADVQSITRFVYRNTQHLDLDRVGEG